MIKEKRCKGTGKAKGFGCGRMIPVEYFGKANRVYGIGKTCGCYQKWILNSDEGRKILETATLKATKPRRDMIKYKSERQLPKSLHTTKDTVHRYIRERDKGLPCISCNKPWHPDFQAGHYYKAENYSWVRFDFDNIHGQCIYCNTTMDGNTLEYGKNLPYRIGLKPFNELTARANKSEGQGFKWSLDVLSEIRKTANEKRRALKLLKK